MNKNCLISLRNTARKSALIYGPKLFTMAKDQILGLFILLPLHVGSFVLTHTYYNISSSVKTQKLKKFTFLS